MIQYQYAKSVLFLYTDSKMLNEILFILATLTKQASKRTGVEDV